MMKSTHLLNLSKIPIMEGINSICTQKHSLQHNKRFIFCLRLYLRKFCRHLKKLCKHLRKILQTFEKILQTFEKNFAGLSKSIIKSKWNRHHKMYSVPTVAQEYSIQPEEYKHTLQLCITRQEHIFNAEWTEQEKGSVTATYYMQLRNVKHMTSQNVQELLFTYWAP